jgi:histone-lysine N-methyltransferase SETMAR
VVLNRIVRGDESCCLQYDPDTKCVSQRRKHPLSPRPKQSRTIPGAGKVMLTMFFDLLRPLLIDCLPKGINVNADRCDETPEHLKCAIKAERRSKLSRGLVLHHNNARPNPGRTTREKLQQFRWEVLPYSPCSPDVSLCDYLVF